MVDQGEQTPNMGVTTPTSITQEAHPYNIKIKNRTRTDRGNSEQGHTYGKSAFGAGGDTRDSKHRMN